jgi:SanA protein
VLGAGLDQDGSPSGMLEDRLRASATLYRQRRELVRLGVPDSDVFTDHAGFDTLDSVVRARKVFNVSSGIVVTQGFHLPRALWLARHAGLTVHGLEAGAGNGYGYGYGYGSKGTKASVREVIARTKASGDVLTGAQPKFLGPRVDISGDARASRG